jgi:hypothetical protein
MANGRALQKVSQRRSSQSYRLHASRRLFL